MPSAMASRFERAKTFLLALRLWAQTEWNMHRQGLTIEEKQRRWDDYSRNIDKIRADYQKLLDEKRASNAEPRG